MRITIEKLVYGGAGLARTEHGVVFVPRTAPGDVVEVELVERKPDYAVARVTALLDASADRQPPTCPNYDSAGCCHWQHIRYPRQLEIKEAIVRETLQRTGRIPWDARFRLSLGLIFITACELPSMYISESLDLWRSAVTGLCPYLSAAHYLPN